jgi:membrane fusion protein, multidrug efflux system
LLVPLLVGTLFLETIIFMASKIIYSAVAVVGIAAASGAAYWYQNKPQGPTEIKGVASGASAPRAGGAPGGPGGGGPGGPVSVEVAKVEASRLQDDAQSVGSMRSRQNVVLRPEVSGRILSLGFSDGGRVRRGDVMVQLDDVLQRAEVRQADAQVSISRANLKRNQELVAQSFIAQRVVDESAANMQVVEAQLALACARLDRMRVVAPFDGTVGIRSINVGDYVKDGADLVNIEDLSSMYVDFKLPERFQGKLRRDQQVELQLDAMPGRVFKAKVEAIDPQIDANGRSISVRAILPNTAGEPMRPPGGPAGAPPGAAGAAGAGAPGASGVPSRGGMSASKPAVRPAGAGAPPARPPAARPAGAEPDAAPRAADPVAQACAPYSLASRGGPGRAGLAGSTSGAGARGASPAGRPLGSGALPAAGAAKAAGVGGAGRPGAGANAGGGAGGSGPLRPGMFARVNTVFNIKDSSLTVPEEAIVPQGGRQFVIKVVEQTEEQFKVLAEAAKKAAAEAAAAAPSAAASGVVPGGVASGGGGAPGGGPGAGGPGAGGAAAPPAPVFVNGKRLVSLRTEVKIGIRRPGRVEITDGVAEGDTVVVAGQQRLQRDNSPVRVIELGRGGGRPAEAGAATPPQNSAGAGNAGGNAGGAVGLPAAAPVAPGSMQPATAASGASR